MTSNEKIRDELIKRQIRLLRLSAGTNKELRRILKLADGDLRALITRRTDTISSENRRFSKTRTKQLQRLNDSIKALLGETWKDVRKRLREDLTEIGILEAQVTATTITAALPVVIDLNLPTNQLLRTIVTSKPFEGKVLSRHMANLETADRERMMDRIRVGLVQGSPTAAITRDIFGTSQLDFDDALRKRTLSHLNTIVHTSISHITNEAREELYIANKTIIPEKVFTATLDAKTTDVCKRWDGTKHKPGKGPVLPLHHNERSVYTPVINGQILGERPAIGVSDRELRGLPPRQRAKLIRERVGTAPASETYNQFLQKQSFDFQVEAFNGVGKAKLFREGKLPLTKFIDESGVSLSLRQLIKLNPAAARRAGLLKKN